MLVEKASDLVGQTPLLSVTKYAAHVGVSEANIFAKLELFNPAGSVKDRIAKSMIEDAEARGVLREDSILLEPTSGNTGIGLAAIAAAKGYPLTIVLPDSLSVERRAMIQAYGAKLILTPGKFAIKGAIALANRMAAEDPRYVLVGQFSNPANPKAHYETTGPEIWDDLAGQVDVFVAGIGTGGTISGAGRFLREQNPQVKIIAVEPSRSPFLSKGEAGPHALQGIGAGFAPDTLDTTIYDEIITVSDEDAVATAKTLGLTEGVFVGISSGAALKAATEVALRPEFAGKNIVVVLPDSGDRYLSTALGHFPEVETTELPE